MSGANRVNIILNSFYNYTGNPIPITLGYTGPSSGTVTFTITPPAGVMNYTSPNVPLSALIPQGNGYFFTITYGILNAYGVAITTGFPVSSFQLEFSNSSGGPVTFTTVGQTGAVNPDGSDALAVTDPGNEAEGNIACLHGSSMIQMKDGIKRLDQIKSGDEVLSGEGKYAKVKLLVHCYLSFMGADHDAIIFEKDSLGHNEPSERLIIDPGHPMCTKEEFIEKGYDALRPAGTYLEELKGDQILTKKWTDTFVQSEPSLRYDLLLEKPHNTYIANGMIVRAKGYKNHRYKQFV